MDDMDAVYRAHAQTVYKFLLVQCHDPDLAEELTQETFYQAVRSIGRFDGSCKLSVWLCQIAKPLMLPVTQLGAPAVAVPLGVDSRVEDAPTPLAVDFPHRRVRGFACDLIQIPLFQQLLVFLFPLAVVPHRFVTIPYLFENRLNFS